MGLEQALQGEIAGFQFDLCQKGQKWPSQWQPSCF